MTLNILLQYGSFVRAPHVAVGDYPEEEEIWGLFYKIGFRLKPQKDFIKDLFYFETPI